METRKPRDLLTEHELIGFARRSAATGQAVHRASSAKVFVKGRIGATEDAPARRPSADEADG